MDIKKFINFLKLNEQKKFLQILLLITTIIFVDIVVSLIISIFINPFLVISSLFLNSLISYWFATLLLKKSNTQLKNSLVKGEIPYKDFNQFFGAFVVSFLYVIPGFSSTIVAIFLSLEFARSLIGKFIVKKYNLPVDEIYNYVRLYEVKFKD